jgi:hypothetical protein
MFPQHEVLRRSVRAFFWQIGKKSNRSYPLTEIGVILEIALLVFHEKSN